MRLVEIASFVLSRGFIVKFGFIQNTVIILLSLIFPVCFQIEIYFFIQETVFVFDRWVFFDVFI